MICQSRSYSELVQKVNIRISDLWTSELSGIEGLIILQLKGLRPLPPTLADSWFFCLLFLENVFFNFPVGFRVWEDLQSMGNGCGIQTDGFSAHFEPCVFIFDYFQHFADFAVDSKGLRLLPESPVTPSSRVESPVVWCKAQ